MRTSLRTALMLSVAALSMSGAAYAADLVVDTPDVMVTAPSGDTNFYVGVNVGYGWGDADHQPAGGGPPGFPNGYDFGISGVIVGGQVGAMFRLDNSLALGVQADLDWSGISGSLVTGGLPGTITQSVDWIGTVEARLGFDAGGFTPYAAIGGAVAQGTRSSTGGGGTDTNIHTGLSLGVGAMVQVTDNVSLDIEYRRQTFMPQTYDTGGVPASVALNVNSIRAGVNFSF
jgi:outer membrane immunogenic protein